MISCPRDLSGSCPSSACGTALLLSGSAAVMSPAPVPMVPDWAIALLVLVSILLLVSIFTCLLLMVRPHPYPSPHLHSAAWSLSLSPHRPSSDTFSLPKSTCTCRRKSRGKLDLLSQKDSYHPMAEYLQYQSHGRYVSPNSKPNPYSQVRERESPTPGALQGHRAGVHPLRSG